MVVSVDMVAVSSRYEDIVDSPECFTRLLRSSTAIALGQVFFFKKNSVLLRCRTQEPVNSLLRLVFCYRRAIRSRSYSQLNHECILIIMNLANLENGMRMPRWCICERHTLRHKG